MTARVKLTFEEGFVISSNTCSYGGKSVYVQAVSPAMITEEEIMILGDSNARREYSPGFLECKTSVDKGVLKYKVIQDNLILQMANESERIELSRSGQTFTQARRLGN